MSNHSSYSLKREGSKVYLLGVVKGLVTEAERLEKIVKNINFDVGALPISKEEVEGLKEFIYDDELEMDIEPSKPEKIYAEKLSEFDEVSLPPPSYVFFVKYCIENEIEIEALDMDEEHYTMAYCDHVTGSQWLRQSFREKMMGKKSIDAESPVEFVKKWDGYINKLEGFQELEKHREKVMAKNLSRLSKRGNLVGLIEEERIEGVRNFLKNR